MLVTIELIIDYLNVYYYAHRKFFLLAIACALLLLIFDKHSRNRFIIPLAIIVFVVVNPILYEKVFYQIIYRRLFWLFSDVILVCLFVVKVLMKVKNEYLKYLLFVLACISIMVLGQYQYNKEDRFEKTVSLEKLPYGVTEVCDYILSQDIEPDCIMDIWLSNYTRQYSADIRQLFGRNATGYISSIGLDARFIYNMMVDQAYSEVLAYADKNDYNFVVLEDNVEIDKNILDRYGFKDVYSIGQYHVYQNGFDESVESFDNWRLTSYNDLSGDMCIFYTLYNQKDDYLIVVDGGSSKNEKQIRDVINLYGGKVDAWILTHFHPDHVEAFNSIIYNPGNIEIKKIYSAPISYQYYLEVATEYDYPETFTDFRKTIKKYDNYEYLYTGDILDLNGLKLEVITAADSILKEFSDDYPNDASLVFKISGQENNILFLGDIKTDRMCQYVIDNYADKLDAQYLQINHHGNSQFDKQFYELISPEVVIFDTPAWLFEEKKNVQMLWDYFNSIGIDTYDFKTAANSFEFK